MELSSDWSLTPAGCLFLDMHIDGNNLESCLEVSIVCDVVCRLKSDTIRMFISSHGHGWQHLESSWLDVIIVCDVCGLKSNTIRMFISSHGHGWQHLESSWLEVSIVCDVCRLKSNTIRMFISSHGNWRQQSGKLPGGEYRLCCCLRVKVQHHQDVYF